MINKSIIKTCEFVSPKHPDKVCDFIADSILDAYFIKDKNTRAGIEVMGGHGVITISGEITSCAKINIENIVKKIVGNNIKIITKISKQSPDIARGVDIGGAGDQGIMIGYASNETANLMPYEYELARDLCKKVYKKYPYDGKVQVTINNKEILVVIVSFQNTKTKDLKIFVKSIINAKEYIINPAGEWNIGGFDADTGLTGRKPVVDNYGPEIRIGGGSFSGKDWTKVDRSGAYMARKIAVDYLKKNNAKEVVVKLAYSIGKKEPVMARVVIDAKEKEIIGYDLSPRKIKKFLKLDEPIYAQTSQWGHFGNNFNWDK